MTLLLRDGRLAIARLDADAAIPAWAAASTFLSLTRTGEELSIVCDEAAVPDAVRAERGWRLLRVSGVLDLSLVGVLAGLSASLARADVSLFAVSTFDTDYLLVRDDDLDRAVRALRDDGHEVEDRSGAS